MQNDSVNPELYKSNCAFIKERHASISGSSLNIPKMQINELTGEPLPELLDSASSIFGDNDLFAKPGIDMLKAAGINPTVLAKALHTDVKIINDIYDGKPVPWSKIPNKQSFKHTFHILTVSMVLSTPDKSLRSTIRHLINENGMARQTLALYADVEDDKLEAFLENTENLSDAEKFRLLHYSRMFNILFNGVFSYSIKETEVN